MFAIGPCYTCGKYIRFNPYLVPAIPADKSGTGTREPVCRECIEKANPARIKNGLEPIIIHPDAYETDKGLN
jgi:hypothetical protein